MKQDELVTLFQKCIGKQTPYIRREGGAGPRNSTHNKYKADAFKIHRFMRSWFLRSQFGWTIGFPTQLEYFDELFIVKGKSKKNPNILFKQLSLEEEGIT